MKALNSSICLVLSACWMNLSAQLSEKELSAMYAALVAELNTAVSAKACEKTWKDEQAAWAEKAGNAAGISEMCAALNDFQAQLQSDKAWTSAWPGKKTKWNKTCGELKKWDAFGNHLIEFESYIDEGAYSKEWAGRRNGWLSDVRSANQEYLDSEKLKNPEVNIDKAKFNETFTTVFRTSIAGLASLRKGEPSMKDVNGDQVSEWTTDMAMPAAAGHRLEYSKRVDLHTYVVWWSTGPTQENASRIAARVAAMVDAIKPADFAKHDKYSKEYVDYKQYLFEFNSDKFADLQKRPTVEVGAVKSGEGYAVQLKITEPYFKNQYKF